MVWKKNLFVAATALAATTAFADVKFKEIEKLQKDGSVEFRTINGFGNNTQNPKWGEAEIPLIRLTPADYSANNGLSGQNRPGARAISNAVSSQSASIPNQQGKGVSDFIWQWGQFLDHDLDLSEGSDGEEANIPVPAGDIFFDPLNTGVAVIPFERVSGEEISGVREQSNAITAFIDASNVYGSDDGRATELRTMDGTGRLKTSAGNLLPFNENGFANAGGSDNSDFFLAGDVRANEQVGLISIHTLFVREHNRLAAKIAEKNEDFNGDEIYEYARVLVGAQMQAITYNEFLPALLGKKKGLKKFKGYDTEVDASIANEFSTAAFRFGHSTLSDSFALANGGTLLLRDSFFRPSYLTEDPSRIGDILEGLGDQVAQRIDTKIVDGLRNFLFGPPGSGGFDLASLNIQRGRDHGLPSYNDMREHLGLDRKESFDDITDDFDTATGLAFVYDSVDDIDAWVGGLAENKVKGSMLGELFHTIIKDQFERLRSGDRFFYQHNLKKNWQKWVEKQTLGKIIKRNTGRKMAKNVFFVKSDGNPIDDEDDD